MHCYNRGVTQPPNMLDFRPVFISLEIVCGYTLLENTGSKSKAVGSQGARGSCGFGCLQPHFSRTTYPQTTSREMKTGQILTMFGGWLRPSSKQLAVQWIWCYPLTAFPASPTLDFKAFCEERYLFPADVLHFLNILRKFCKSHGQEKCWCLKKAKDRELVSSISTSQNQRPRYKGVDARELLLALMDQSPTETKSIIVRHSSCQSTYCINPLHYFYGTRQDAMWQHTLRKGSEVSPQVVQSLRDEHSLTRRSYASLAREYKLPYHTVRRICTHEYFAWRPTLPLEQEGCSSGEETWCSERGENCTVLSLASKRLQETHW